MFDYAYSQFKLETVYQSGDVLGTVRVDKGDQKEVDVIVEEPLSILLKKGEKTDGLTERVTVKGETHAPIEQGDNIGEIVIEKDGKEYITRNLVASETVDKASLWRLMKRTSSVLFGDVS